MCHNTCSLSGDVSACWPHSLLRFGMPSYPMSPHEWYCSSNPLSEELRLPPGCRSACCCFLSTGEANATWSFAPYLTRLPLFSLMKMIKPLQPAFLSSYRHAWIHRNIYFPLDVVKLQILLQLGIVEEIGLNLSSIFLMFSLKSLSSSVACWMTWTDVIFTVWKAADSSSM